MCMREEIVRPGGFFWECVAPQEVSAYRAYAPKGIHRDNGELDSLRVNCRYIFLPEEVVTLSGFLFYTPKTFSALDEMVITVYLCTNFIPVFRISKLCHFL
uniref:Uncharacterized protein n=1 Tax=Odontella aurita TaxID=265563 RepID=A0A7S4MA66_9STRA